MTRRRADDALRELPCNLEAERSVIGSLLIENKGYELIAGKLKPEAFFRKVHRQIYAACCRLLDAGKPLDFVALCEALGPELEDVGGPAYIGSMTDGVPRATNIEYYADLVIEKALAVGLIRYGQQVVERAYADRDAVRDQIRDAELHLSVMSQATEAHSLQSVPSMLPALTARIAKRVERRGQISGWPTGFPELDLYTHGWQPGHLIVIGGRTSHGKSALALQFATTIARAGGRVAYFSFEMGEAAMMDRLQSALSVDEGGKGVPITASHWGNYGKDEYRRVAAAQEAMHGIDNLEFSFYGSRQVVDVERQCRAVKADRGLAAAVVDHFQLIDVEGENRTQQLALVSRRLQNLARDLDITLFVLSQLTLSDAKDGNIEPDVDHIRDCKSLGHDAHDVFMLHPHKAADARSEVPVVLMKLLIRKQREGRLGRVWLDFERDYMRFTQSAEPRPEPKAAPKEPKPMRSPLIL